MNGPVFISYSAPDEAVALQLKQDIEGSGFTVFYAPVQLQGGDRLSTIHDYIFQAKHFLALVSRSSVNSKWVQHELNTALALQLDGKPLDIVPLILEMVERPVAVADLVSVDFRISKRVQGLAEVLRRLTGGEGRQISSMVTTFRSLLEGMIVIPDEAYETIENVLILAEIDQLATGKSMQSSRQENDPAVQRYLNETKARVRATVDKELRKTSLSSADIDRVVHAFDAGFVLPIVGQNAKANLIKWLKQSTDELPDLAATLWRSYMNEHLRGVTRDWLIQYLQEHDMAVSDVAELPWQADELASAAKRGGLLADSTEGLWPDVARRDAKTNP
jgi:hypothetical protein